MGDKDTANEPMESAKQCPRDTKKGALDMV